MTIELFLILNQSGRNSFQGRLGPIAGKSSNKSEQELMDFGVWWSHDKEVLSEKLVKTLQQTLVDRSQGWIHNLRQIGPPECTELKTFYVDILREANEVIV